MYFSEDKKQQNKLIEPTCLQDQKVNLKIENYTVQISQDPITFAGVIYSQCFTGLTSGIWS